MKAFSTWLFKATHHDELLAVARYAREPLRGDTTERLSIAARTAGAAEALRILGLQA